MKRITINVKEKDDLINYILNNSDYSKSKIKSLIKYKKITVNNKTIKKLPMIVSENDVIVIDLEKEIDTPFEILYEDKEILVVNKDSGLLTIGTHIDNENTLYKMVRKYATESHFQVFIVNRLDKETSGIVMFAKSERIKLLYQNNWNELVKKRGYIAVVEGVVKESGRIENLLYEEKSTFVHSSSIGKKAITNYSILKSNSKYTMLDINIETGRKNQIRVHMSELGYPVVGDKKYKSASDPIKRMCLHAYELVITHPITKDTLKFYCEYPKIFDKLVR